MLLPASTSIPPYSTMKNTLGLVVNPHRISTYLLTACLFLPSLSVAQPSYNWLFQRLSDMARFPDSGSYWSESSRRAYESYGLRAMMTKDSSKRSEVLTYRALGELKYGNYDRAFADYEAAVKLNPKKAGEIGWRYLFLFRDYARALTHLQAFDELTPNFDDPIDDYSVNYLKGRAYAGLGDHENALKAYTLTISQRAARLGMEWVDYRYLVARGVSYLAHKQATEALADFDMAIKNYPKSSMANYHRGRALEKLGRTEEAKIAYGDSRFFLVSNNSFERDYYYEQPDAAYEEDIEEAIQRLK